MSEFKRQCPVCSSDIYHTSKCNLMKMVRLNSCCAKCRGKSQRKYSVEKLERVCPKCECNINYDSIKLYNQAMSRNSMCKMCSYKNRPPCSEKTKNKISIANFGENNGMFGGTHSEEYKQELSEKLKKFPLKQTETGIEKMRNSLRKKYAEKFIKTGYKFPRVNIKACEFIDQYGKENGYSFIHGLNGGEKYFKEVGAFVDGYDEKTNTIFEYDEKHHFDRFGNLIKKDTDRMQALLKHTGCKIIRYNELKKTIKEYTL